MSSPISWNEYLYMRDRLGLCPNPKKCNGFVDVALEQLAQRIFDLHEQMDIIDERIKAGAQQEADKDPSKLFPPK